MGKRGKDEKKPSSDDSWSSSCERACVCKRQEAHAPRAQCFCKCEFVCARVALHVHCNARKENDCGVRARQIQQRTEVSSHPRTISNRAARFLSGVYGNETFPYADAKSKKPIPRPELCEFELTHGETSEPADTAVIRARAGVCPLTTPSEQFLFQELLLDGLDQIVYERGEIPGGLTEDND